MPFKEEAHIVIERKYKNILDKHKPKKITWGKWIYSLLKKSKQNKTKIQTSERRSELDSFAEHFLK